MVRTNCVQTNELILFSYVRRVSEEQNEVFLPIYNKCSLTDPEYHALVALVMSELGMQYLQTFLVNDAVIDSDIDISDEAQRILNNYRIEVLKDLERYYKEEMGLTDISSRLGNLMSLNHAIQVRSIIFIFYIQF